MTLVQDIRLAVRLLAKDRWFTCLAIAAIGIGIGVNHTFFTLVNTAVLSGLPIERSADVAFISLRDTRNAPRGLDGREFDDLRRESRTFASIGAFTSAPTTLLDEVAPPERVLATSLSENGFRVLGVAPHLGRHFQVGDDRAGTPGVVLLSEQLWRRRYGGDPSVVGREVTVDGTTATVVGVMPEGFRFPGNTDLWRSLPSTATSPSPDARTLSVFGRLAPDSNHRRAQQEFESIVATWRRQRSEAYRGLTASVVPIDEQFLGRVTDPQWLAFLTVGVLVFLVACANVANLLLMRGARRGRELAIRTALGATRSRIVRQLLTEAGVLSALGAVAGVLLSYAGLGLLRSIVPADVTDIFTFTLEPRVMVVLIASTAAGVMLFGLAPAIHAARGPVAGTLKEAAVSGGRTRRRWATAFVAIEFALTLVLLTNVVLGARQIQDARAAEFAIDPAPLLTMSISLPNEPYSTPDDRAQFVSRLEETLSGVPAVSAVAIASALAGGGGPLRQVTIAGRSDDSNGSAASAVVVHTNDEYFDAIGVPLLRGRSFGPGDDASAEPSAIVNERFARSFLGRSEPVGSLIRLSTPAAPATDGPWLRVVGVVPTVRQRQLGIEPDPVVYLPLRTAPPSTLSIVLRTPQDPAALTPSVREAVRHLDATLPVYRAMSMADAMQALQRNRRISVVILNGISVMAFVLALIGLYAITAYSVSLRRREMGIRLAVGARPSKVGALVLRQALFQICVGLTAGIAGTAAFDRAFTATPMRLTDPVVLLPTLIAVVLVGAAACAWPAARAARLDPALVLREE